MQPILPAGGAICTVTSHPSTVGLSSAPPSGSVVTSTLASTAEGTKQVGSHSKPGPGASSPGKENAGEKKDSGNEGSDFDPVSAMEWKDGVGQLPGSDLKVGSYSSCKVSLVACFAEHVSMVLLISIDFTP